MILVDCYFCNYKTNGEEILFENEYAVCITRDEPILIDSCVIIPKAHVETPFDLTHEEWLATKELLDKVKMYLDKKCSPDGYNLGWNIGSVGGQTVFHLHLHVIPRYKDEPYAGFGIRHWLKMEENKRP
jgi:diadenosine tetraphosphate (Ap4A) HIT family hydrolase